jgi:hypothetical protein
MLVLLPSVLLGFFLLSMQDYPKIFADELNGIDTVRQIFNSGFPDYTSYSVGLGLLLIPFYIFSQSPSFLFFMSLVLNIFASTLSLAIIVKVLRASGFKQVYLPVLVASLYTGSLIHGTHAMTESMTMLFASVAVLKFQESQVSHPRFNRFEVMLAISFGFFSVIHVRVLILILFIYIFEILMTFKGKIYFSRKYILVVQLVSILAFQALNVSIKGTLGGPSSYATSPLSDIKSFVIIFSQVLAGHLVALHLVTFGLFLSLLLLKLPRSKNSLSQDFGIPSYVISITLISIFVSAYFIASISLSGNYDSSVQNSSLGTRYFDPFIPICLALGLASLSKEIYLDVRKFLSANILLFYVAVISTFVIIYFNFSIADPVRSPLIFGITGGAILDWKNLLPWVMLVLICGICWIQERQKIGALVLSLVFLMSLQKPIGWAEGLKLGFTKNHEISSVLNKYELSELSELRGDCIQMVIRDPRNWWSVNSYQYWSQNPIRIASERNSCRFLITDTLDLGNSGRLIYTEDQATKIYLFDFDF